jgi:NAD(P)-dependent dehydrogenase (short-subunit alcohol dehydrogenase family)
MNNVLTPQGGPLLIGGLMNLIPFRQFPVIALSQAYSLVYIFAYKDNPKVTRFKIVHYSMLLSNPARQATSRFLNTKATPVASLFHFYRRTFVQTGIMPGKYSEAHRKENLGGPGDARPTALQIIKDEGLEGKMLDKVFLVTGASAGIGVETGRAFAATGGKVFLTVRDLKKGEEACKSFLQPGRVELLEMDQNSLESVRAAAKTFLSKSSKLNVLVDNAGIMACPQSKTLDGFESQFGVNHLAHFLFFNLLKNTMLASSTPEFNSRVVNVSSSGHASGEVQFDNYEFQKGNYSPWAGYGQAKTANIYMASEIENRYGTKGLHGLALHPGGIWTGLQKHVSAEQLEKWKTPETLLHIKSLEQGAATSVLAAVGKEYEGKGRLYLDNCETAKEGAKGSEGYAPHAFDKEKEARLWNDSLKMVGLA